MRARPLAAARDATSDDDELDMGELKIALKKMMIAHAKGKVAGATAMASVMTQCLQIYNHNFIEKHVSF